MPDYTVIKSLRGELKVTVSELMDAEETEEKSVRARGHHSHTDRSTSGDGYKTVPPCSLRG